MTHGILLAATNGGPRRDHDFYPTPPEPTQALLPWMAEWPKRVWEPACGDGGIAQPLMRGGFDVVGTDLIDRGFGHGGVDFLQTSELRAPSIVTNPPFGALAHPFIEHALNLGVGHMAMLLNLNFWSAAKRTPLWNRRKPAAVLALCWRPDFTGAGSPYFNCAWTIWNPEPATHTAFERLSEPSIAPVSAVALQWQAYRRRCVLAEQLKIRLASRNSC